MSEKATKGRNKLYTDEILLKIIDQYIRKNTHVIKLVPNKIAKFAQEEFGFEKIRYSQFINSPVSKKAIDEFNEAHNKITMPTKVSQDKFAKINTDALIDAYYKEPLKLKSALRQFNDKYVNACKESINQRAIITDLNNKVEELNQQIQEFEEKYNDLRKQCSEQAKKNRENAKKIANANRIEKLHRSLSVYEYLMSKNIASPMDEDNLKIILFNAGLLKEDEKVGIEDYLEKIESNDENIPDEDTPHENDFPEDEFYIEYEDGDYLEEFEEEMSEDDYLTFFNNLE